MRKSHGANELIIALAVVRMTPQHQRNGNFLPRCAKLPFSFLGRSLFFLAGILMYVFIDLPRGLSCCSQSALYWTVAF